MRKPGAALISPMAGDVGRDEVDAADVEADRLDRPLGHDPVVVVDDVRLVDRRAAGRQVPRRAQVEDLARGEDRSGVEPRLLEQPLGLEVELEAGQHLLVADAAAGILVGGLDQLRHRVRAVAGHVAGDALRRRHHLAVDHQDAVVVPWLEALDDHHRGELIGGLERRPHLLGGGEVDRHPLAVVAVERLDDHRIAQPLGGGHGVLRPAHPLLLRHRQPEVAEDLVGQPLVGSDVDGGVTCLAGHRRLDAALVLAVAELHQRAVVQADPRHVAVLGGAHQRPGRGAESAALGDAHQVLELGLEVVGAGKVGLAVGRQQMAEQPQPRLGGLEPHRLLVVAEDDVVLAARQVVAARLAVADRGAGEDLELQRHVLEDVPHPGPLVLGQAAHEPPRLAVGAGMGGEGRDRREQPVVEPRQLGGRVVLQLSEVDAQADHLAQGVQVGAAVDARIEDLHSTLPGFKAKLSSVSLATSVSCEISASAADPSGARPARRRVS